MLKFPHASHVTISHDMSAFQLMLLFITNYPTSQNSITSLPTTNSISLYSPTDTPIDLYNPYSSTINIFTTLQINLLFHSPSKMLNNDSIDNNDQTNDNKEIANLESLDVVSEMVVVAPKYVCW